MIPASSLRDFSPWFANFSFGAYRGGKFVDIPYQSFLRHHVFTFSISTIHAVLLTGLVWKKLSNNMKIISSS